MLRPCLIRGAGLRAVRIINKIWAAITHLFLPSWHRAPAPGRLSAHCPRPISNCIRSGRISLGLWLLLSPLLLFYISTHMYISHFFPLYSQANKARSWWKIKVVWLRGSSLESEKKKRCVGMTAYNYDAGPGSSQQFLVPGSLPSPWSEARGTGLDLPCAPALCRDKKQIL